MSSFQKTLLASVILLVLVVLVLSQGTFAKRVGLPAGLFEMVRDWLATNPTLSAADYKDGTILLIKPIATGVGEGRYEAGDIVEIRDGEEMFKRFGNGNFLGNEERTTLLPVYYPHKLTEEEKKMLLEPEYENNSPPASPDASRGGQPSLNIREGVPPLNLRGDEGELQKDQKPLLRLKTGLDYTLFLSDRDILKVRSFQQLDRLPEIDLSNIIDKKSGLSLGDPNSNVIARSPAKRDDEAIPPALRRRLRQGEWNTAIASNGGSSSGLLRFARNDRVLSNKKPAPQNAAADSAQSAKYYFAKKSAAKLGFWPAFDFGWPDYKKLSSQLAFFDSFEKINGSPKNFASAHFFNINDNYADGFFDIKAQNISKIFIKSQQDQRVFASETENFFISSSLKSFFSGLNNADSVFFQGPYQTGRNALVGEYSHELFDQHYPGWFSGQLSDKINSRQDACLADSVFFGDFINGPAGPNKVEDVFNGNSGSFDAGLSKTDIRIDSDKSLSFHNNNYTAAEGNVNPVRSKPSWTAAVPTAERASNGVNHRVIATPPLASGGGSNPVDNSNGGSSSGLLRRAIALKRDSAPRNDGVDSSASNQRSDQRPISGNLTSVVRLPQRIVLYESARDTFFSSPPQARPVRSELSNGVERGIKGEEVFDSSQHLTPTLSSTEERGQNIVSAVRLPARIVYYEKTRDTIKKLAQAIIKPVFAQGGPTEVVKTVDTGGYADYLSLSAWEAGQQADLTSTNEIRIAKCRHATATSTADQVAVSISGWTTDATRYIKIWTDPTESYRHNGKWDTGKYRLQYSNAVGVVIYADHVRVEGLQFYLTSHTSSNTGGIFTRNSGSGSDFRFSHNIIRGDGNVAASWVDGIQIYASGAGVVRAWNNIIYDYKTTSGILISDGGFTAYLYNNTVYNNAYGIWRYSEGTAVLQNNLIASTTDPFAGTFAAGTDYNATDINDTPGVGSNNRVSQTFLFADSANSDFHLAYADTGAKDYGTNLSADTNLAFSTDIDNQTRSGTWDIGADEYQATPIYRSVGPSNTTALASSTGATLTISGDTATFSTGLANNIGVGDVIQYNATSSTGAVNSLAFISGRASPTSYTVKDAAGKIASSTSANTGWSIFRAYTSLSNAEAGTENTGIPSGLRNFDTWTLGKNLASSTEQWNIAAYADATDTTAVTIDGWTTTADNYIRIFTPVSASEVGASQRHQGKWDTGKYRLETGINQRAFDIFENYVRIDGLQIAVQGNQYSLENIAGITNPASAAEFQVSNCIMKASLSGTAGGNAVHFYSATGVSYIVKMWNNIIYDRVNGSTEISGIYIGGDNQIVAYLYNNTVQNSYIGFRQQYSAVVIAKNNISYNNTDNYSGTFNASSTNNLSGPTQTDAPGSNPRNGVTVQFVDPANKDFHLRLGDSAARNNGANLRADANLAFSDDIDGQQRPETGAWDIGADEVARTTQIQTPLSGRFKDSSLVGYWSFDGANMGTSSALDLSGNSNTGWLINGVKKVPGINGQALNFKRSLSQSVNLGNPASLQITGAMTLSAWVKQTTLNNNQYIISKGGSSGQRGWEMNCIYDGGLCGFFIAQDTNTLVAVGSNTPGIGEVGVWVHLVGVYTPSTSLKLYKNGILRETNTTSIPASQFDQAINVVIGSRGNLADGLFMDGLIDEVRIYNRALSASEIADQYRAGAAEMRVNTPITQTLTSGLVGNWTFNGQDMNWASSTAEALDRSGQNNNGNVINFGKEAVRPGQVGQALSFDGVDDWVNVGTVISTSNPVWTICSWIKQNGTASKILIGYITNQFIRFNGDTANGRYYNSASAYINFSSGGVSYLNVWNYHCFVGTGTQFITYTNGVQTDIDDIITSSNFNGIGGWAEGLWFFNGLIDEVRVYNRALTADEILQLYRAGSKGAVIKQ